MRIVAALRPGPDVRGVVQALRCDGHALVLAWTLDDLTAAVRQPSVDAVIVDSGFASLRDADLVALVRQRVAVTTTVVALLPDPWPGDVQRLFDAGVDDVVRRPLMAAEVALRIARRNGAQLARGATLASTWLQFEFWRDLVPLVHDTMLDMVGVQLESAVAAPGGLLDVAGLVVMALPNDHAECLVGVGVDAPGGAALADAMFPGDSSPGLLADAVGELANAAAGAVKRAALPCGKMMSMGVPRIVSPLTPPTTVERSWQLRFPCGAALTCLAAMRSVRPVQVRCAALREGMVLSRDLLAPSGALLAPLGAALTERTVARLRELLGDHSAVEVIEPNLAL